MPTTEAPAEELELIRFTAVCTRCQKSFQASAVPDPWNPGRPMFTKRVCDPCVFSHNERVARDGVDRTPISTPETRRAAEWEAICPKAYRTTAENGITDLDRLRKAQPLIHLAEGGKDRAGVTLEPYAYNYNGLLFRGESGASKTRVMWRVLRRQFDAGRSIIALSAGEFERQFRDASGDFTPTAPSRLPPITFMRRIMA